MRLLSFRAMCIMSGKDKNRNCPICNEKLESLTSLHLHCVRNHARNFICCAICYELFKHRSDLVKHSNAQHDRRTKTSNRITKQDFKAFKSLNFVKRMVDGSKCMACSKYFKNQYIAQTHYRDLHLMVKFLCHRCPEIFTTINNLKCHFDVEHANETAFIPQKDRKKSSEKLFEARNIVKVNPRDLSDSRLEQLFSRTTFDGSDDSNGFALDMERRQVLKLTYQKNTGAVRLLPYVMNDFNEFVDLTTKCRLVTKIR